VDVTAEAEQDWVGQVMDASLASIKFLESCTPGYYNNEGQPNGELIRRNGTYAPGIMAFSKLVEAWRGDGSLAGVEMR
jgi:cyclohexanone monooxygenase